MRLSDILEDRISALKPDALALAVGNVSIRVDRIGHDVEVLVSSATGPLVVRTARLRGRDLLTDPPGRNRIAEVARPMAETVKSEGTDEGPLNEIRSRLDRLWRG